MVTVIVIYMCIYNQKDWLQSRSFGEPLAEAFENHEAEARLPKI